MKNLSRLNEGLRRQVRIAMTDGEEDTETDPAEAGKERTAGIPKGKAGKPSGREPGKKMESLGDLIRRGL